MNQPDTPRQSRKSIPLADGGQLSVRRMYNKPARDFLKQIVAEALNNREFLGLVAPVKADTPEAKQAELLARIEKLPALILAVDSLADTLVAASTDDPQRVEQLDFVEWLQVLAAAIELNLGTDLKNSFAAIVDALVPLLSELAAKTTPKTGSTPSPS